MGWGRFQASIEAYREKAHRGFLHEAFWPECGEATDIAEAIERRDDWKNRPAKKEKNHGKNERLFWPRNAVV